MDTITELWSKGKSPLLDSWPLYTDPLAVLLILLAYFIFIYAGPKFMKNREPCNIKIVLVFYNAIKMVYNGGVLIWAGIQPNAIKKLLSFGCAEIGPQGERDFHTVVCVVIWHMTIVKVLDLLDTVFFVLRKRQNQVTFLHVQHHSMSVLLLWIIEKYFTGMELVIAFVCNSIVHATMYFYYLIAVLGPAFKKYLWWKKYLTMLQMIQFLVIIAYMIASFWLSCGFNRIVIWIAIVDAILNFVLFMKYYLNAYHPKEVLKADGGQVAQNA